MAAARAAPGGGHGARLQGTPDRSLQGGVAPASGRGHPRPAARRRPAHTSRQLVQGAATGERGRRPRVGRGGVQPRPRALCSAAAAAAARRGEGALASPAPPARPGRGRPGRRPAHARGVGHVVERRSSSRPSKNLRVVISSRWVEGEEKKSRECAAGLHLGRSPARPRSPQSFVFGRAPGHRPSPPSHLPCPTKTTPPPALAAWPLPPSCPASVAAAAAAGAATAPAGRPAARRPPPCRCPRRATRSC